MREEGHRRLCFAPKNVVRLVGMLFSAIVTLDPEVGSQKWRRRVSIRFVKQNPVGGE
jgi:hypothetical protein